MANRFAVLARTLAFLAAWTVAGQGQIAPKMVSHAEALGAVKTRVQPEYPVVARQLKIQGSVELEALVTETGTVEDVMVTSGNPVLTKPAAAALRKWKFVPFTQEGRPVRAIAPVTIVFKQ